MKTIIVEYAIKNSDYDLNCFIDRYLEKCEILLELEGIIDFTNVRFDSKFFKLVKRNSLETFQYEKLFDIDNCILYIIIGERSRGC
jgi:hypothetical protein